MDVTHTKPPLAHKDKPPVTGAGPLNGLLTWVDQRLRFIDDRGAPIDRLGLVADD